MRRRNAENDPERVNAFELGYFAAISRIRKELPLAWKAGVLTALSNTQIASELADDPGALTKRRLPHVHAFRLIIMRCETAATMLTWRKELAPDQKQRLRLALHRLQNAAKKLGVE